MAMRWTWRCDTADPQRIAAFWTEREHLIRTKAGATVVRDEFYDGQFGHVVMLDPEGNKCCVA